MSSNNGSLLRKKNKDVKDRSIMSVAELQASIRQSAVNRIALEKKLGLVPLSILRLNRSHLSKRMFIYQHDVPTRNMAHLPENKEKQKRLQEAGYLHASSSPSSRMAGRGTLGTTIMPAEIVEFFIKYYAHTGQVYLDPFMGQGVRMQVAKLLGLHYYGYDISQEFFKYCEAVKRKIDDSTTAIQIFCEDSRQPEAIPDDIGDFCFTSPPYWDIEYYGDEPEQLGYKQTYEDFLQGMYEVAAAWFPKFKSGATYILNVNDFRKNGRFYPYHSHVIDLYERAGWETTDVWIVEGLVGGLPKAFAVDFNMKRIAPKVHEYALIFTKP